MDLLQLERISKALENSLDRWGWLLLIFTGVVVVGLVVEYWHDVKELCVFATWPMASFPWEKLKRLTGGVLVTLGVAGELFVTYEASRVESNLRNNNHKIEALLTQQAGDAASAAARAKAAADGAVASGNEAEAKASHAFNLAAAAQAQLADRKLTDDQVRRIATKLSQFAGQEYTVTAYWQSKESVGIADRVHTALQMAHWSYLPEGQKSFMLGGIIGILVWTHPNADETTKQAAGALIKALRSEGLEAFPRTQNPIKNPKHNKIGLDVGAKR